MSTEYLKQEAPFGEFTGYMGMEMMAPIFDVTCITHRENTIYNAFISQFLPSESSKLRHLSHEGIFYKVFKHDGNIPGILDVAFHEESGSSGCCLIKMKKTHLAQPWQALNSAVELAPNVDKFFIFVDDDIDPGDWDSIVWAFCWRVQAQRDTRVTPGKNITPDY